MHKTIFLHITKTAGGSLRSGMERLIGKRVAFCDDVARVKHIDKNTDIIFGHLVFGVHKDFASDVKYMAFVRHPVARTISHFYHLFNVDPSNEGDIIRRYGNIDSYFQSELPWYFRNFMCRIISGEPYSRLRDHDLFNKSMDKIEKYYSFIGITEHMELSLMNLGRVLGEPISIYQNVNIGSYDIGLISNSTFNRIVDSNRADIQLYNAISSVFLRKFSEHQKDAGSTSAREEKQSVVAQ